MVASGEVEVAPEQVAILKDKPVAHSSLAALWVLLFVDEVDVRLYALRSLLHWAGFLTKQRSGVAKKFCAT